MTINVQTVFVVHRGNDSAREFPYNFRISERDMVRVHLREFGTNKVIRPLSPSEYTITGVTVENTSGGVLTYPLTGSPIPLSQEIVIERVLDYTQDLSLLSEGGWYPAAVEYQLDKIVMQIQQLAQLLQQSVKVPVGSSPIILNAPSPSRLLYITDEGVIAESETTPDERSLRIAGDKALSDRLDGYMGDITNQVTKAENAAEKSEYWANQSGVFRDESAEHARISHDLVEAAVAGFQGFTDGMGYDFGWVTSDMTYFNRDWGTV